MRLVYSPRAIRDLERIAVYYHSVAGPKIATAISERIEQVINRIAARPMTAPPVSGRRNVRVVLVRRYPYKIFYRLSDEAVEILHIRHTAQRPWVGE
jgi:toxin ParE1/3/4